MTILTAFYMSCLHFTGASSLKILLLLPPAGVAAIHYAALLKIRTNAMPGAVVSTDAEPYSRQMNMRAFPGSGQTPITKNVT